MRIYDIVKCVPMDIYRYYSYLFEICCHVSEGLASRYL